MGKLDEISRKIAAEYINSIIFIDDNIFFPEHNEAVPGGGNSHADTTSIDEFPLNADSISKSFARFGIPCSFLKYDNRGETDSIVKLLRRSDVGIIDWRIIIDDFQSSEALLEKAEEVVEDTGAGRGEEAKRLIKQFIKCDPDCPKLIIIYTADSSEDIINLLGLENGVSHNDNTWVSNNGMLRIVVWYKEERESSRMPDGKSGYIVKHDLFPQKVIDEFALLHKGILPCIALKIINEIRQNSKMLLGRYNGSLDPAFIIHRAMSDNPIASNSIILDSILTSIESFIDYSNVDRDVIDKESLSDWVDVQRYSEIELAPNKEKKSVKIKTTNDVRKNWIIEGFIPTLGHDASIGQYLKNNSVMAFTPEQYHNPYFKEEFSINTLHKSHFCNEDKIHNLSLGSVVMSSNNGKNDYLICIQQKCDSVRLGKDEVRKFLFLPLKVIENNKIDNTPYDLICRLEPDSNNFLYFKINQSNSFNLHVIEFKQYDKNTEISTRVDDNGKPYFEDVNSKCYYWLFDLKDAKAQSIINNFASKISRVGLNEYEWLRVQPNRD